MRELSEIKKDFPDFMQFIHEKSSVDQVFVEFVGPEEDLHAGEHFQILIEPRPEYIFVAPEVFVTFLTGM